MNFLRFVIFVGVFVARVAGANVILNGDFESGTAGWSVATSGSASAYVTNAIASNALVIVAGSINSSGTAEVSQDLPPIPVSSVSTLTIKNRLSAQGTKPFVKFTYSDGSTSSAYFGTVTADAFTWVIDDLKPLLSPGKVLTRLQMTISDFSVVAPVSAYLDDVTLNTNAIVPKNLLQNPGFESYSLYGLPNTEANFIAWDEGPTSPAIIPFADLYANYPMESGPSNRGTSKNKAYAFGGNDPETTLAQWVTEFGWTPTQIDDGIVSFELAGWLGGFRKQADDVLVELGFYDALNQKMKSEILGPVSDAGRQSRTRMNLMHLSGLVPSQTRKMLVKVTFRRFIGVVNNSSVDDLSLVLFGQPARMSGFGSVPGYSGQHADVQIIATLTNPISHEVIADIPVKWNDDNSFRFDAHVPAGTYNVSLRTPNSLNTLVRDVRVADGGDASFAFALTLGDMNQDNYIGTDDYLIMSSGFDLIATDVDFDSRADLNGDSYVGTDDYLILNDNFDTLGQ